MKSIVDYTNKLKEFFATKQALTTTNNVIAVNGAKNLLHNTAVTVVDHGVTFTVNSDGTVTASGTANGGDATLVINQTDYFKKGNYILSGCPTGGSTATYELRVSRGFLHQVDDVGNGADLSLGADASSAIYCYIKIANGTAAPSSPFKPMLTLADQADSDYAHYVPYAMTNREITNKMDGEASTITANTSNLSNVGRQYIRKVSGIKNFVLQGNVATQLLAGTEYTVGTLPVGYYPLNPVVKEVVCSSTGNRVLLQIKVSGAITIVPRQNNLEANQSFVISETYI